MINARGYMYWLFNEIHYEEFYNVKTVFEKTEKYNDTLSNLIML